MGSMGSDSIGLPIITIPLGPTITATQFRSGLAFVQRLDLRLESHGLSPTVIRPVDHLLVDRSAPSQKGGYTLGAILPILVIATVLLGAYYPAIDLTAGEKERGSIQTLFTAPITPFEIDLATAGYPRIKGCIWVQLRQARSCRT